jgi:tetratricopeptide (TPR) repeat protein
LAKQDEKQRLRRRLQDYAVQLANECNWEEALEINRKVLEIEEDPATYNRMAKALLELGRYQEAHDTYQQTLRLNPTNTIARRNLSRIDTLLQREDWQTVAPRKDFERADQLIFITEAGKTVLTALHDLVDSSAIDVLSSGEKLMLEVEHRAVLLVDQQGQRIGRLEPKLGQRVSELINGGNRYEAVVVQANAHQVRVLVREVYQDFAMRDRTSFPGSLNDEMAYLSLRYEYETDDMLDEEEVLEDVEVVEEEFSANEEEEIGLDQIEKDLGEDDDTPDE